MSDQAQSSKDNVSNTFANNADNMALSALKQLFCGGMAGAVAKTITAPLSRLTILYQVHSMVTTKEHQPKYAMTFTGGLRKIVERGGYLSYWKGNGTSVLHRFPFSAINFYVYENMTTFLVSRQNQTPDNTDTDVEPTKMTRFLSGAVAGSIACVACYPLDLVRTRLTTELSGREHYKGIVDALQKIVQAEGLGGLYSGIGPTLFVAVPNFAISYTVYGSLKEYVLDDDLFYNLRKIDTESGKETLGLQLTLLCGAASGTLATLLTYPFDTVRRRMQIQNLHVAPENRLTAVQQMSKLFRHEGVHGVYRGLTPEILKVVPHVGALFLVYEYLKAQLNI